MCGALKGQRVESQGCEVFLKVGSPLASCGNLHGVALQILNAGAGLMACGLVSDLGAGVALAREVQRSGKANAVLDNWILLSQVRKLPV